MTWRDAVRAAEQKLDEMERKLGGPPEKVRLADYASEEDLRFLSPEAKWPLAFHRMALRATKRLCERRGINCEVVMLTRPDYLAWLAESGVKNSQAARAAFVSGATPAMMHEYE